MEKYIKQLKNTKLFNGITETELAPMLKCLGALKQSYQKGDCIFRRGEQIHQVAMLL